MYSEDLTKAAKRIAIARPKGRWFHLAREMRRLEKIAPTAEHGQPWPDALFDVLRRELPSITRSYFDKMRAADAYLMDLCRHHGSDFDPRKFEGKPLTAIDIARRMSEFDEQAAMSVMLQIQMGLAGVVEADAALRKARSSRPSVSVPARQRSFNSSQEAARILKKELQHKPQKFLGTVKPQTIIWNPRTSRFGVGCTAMVEVSEGPQKGSFIGFESLVLSDGRERLGWHRRLGQIALSASFFTNYWVILITGEADQLIKDIETLKLDNVGLALIGSGGDIVPILSPKSRTPEIDRRPLIAEAINFLEENPEESSKMDAEEEGPECFTP